MKAQRPPIEVFTHWYTPDSESRFMATNSAMISVNGTKYRIVARKKRRRRRQADRHIVIDDVPDIEDGGHRHGEKRELTDSRSGLGRHGESAFLTGNRMGKAGWTGEGEENRSGRPRVGLDEQQTRQRRCRGLYGGFLEFRGVADPGGGGPGARGGAHHPRPR